MIITNIRKMKTGHSSRSSRWEINNKIINITNYKNYIPTVENLSEIIDMIYKRIIERKDLIDLNANIGNTNILRICKNLLYDLTIEYIKYHIKQFTEEREKIGMRKLVKRIYGIGLECFATTDDLKEFATEIQQLVDQEYMIQCKVFVSNNYKEISLENEVWKLFWMNGPALNSREFNFTYINSPKLRKEVMLYFKEKLKVETNFRSDRNLAVITKGMNFIYNHNPQIQTCLDINKNDVVALLLYLENEAQTQYGKDLTPSTIRKTIQSCGLVVRFMIDYSKNNDNKLHKTINNPFDEIRFSNIKNMEQNSKPIPDVVFEQLKLYKENLNPRYQLISDILEMTGLRAKEVVNLKEGDVYYDDEVEAWVLRYIPFKTLKSRRKNNLPDYHSVVIPESLALAIKNQEEKTKKLRDEFNSQLIFINKSNIGHKISLTQAQGFVNALNRLAKKYNIVDDNGEVWHFTTRQYRKTVAVNMIENGASEQEISLQFGHLDNKTAKIYYAEVRKMRLSKLNTEFFKKKFNLSLGEEQLSLYTEEERKVLYIDFCLKYREVEFGMCTKHMSQGPCGLRVGKANCATCSHLCTGLKYIDKWIALRDSQKKIVDELANIYLKENLTNYEEYKEYKRELHLLKSYQDVIDNIQKKGTNNNDK